MAHNCNLLITGGTGLVGSEFKSGIKVGRREADLTKWAQTKQLFEHHRPQYLVHCAGLVGGVKANTFNIADFYLQNLLMNTNVIECARLLGIKRLCCFLSTCIFPDNINYPLLESYIHLGPPHESNFGYAYAKRMADVHIRAVNQQYGCNYFSVIPTNIYGVNDNFNIDTGHVIPSLIHKCYLAKQNCTEFEVWGTGRPSRQFVYAGDVANIVQRLLIEYHDNDPVIIAGNEEISIFDLATLIADLMGFKGKIRFVRNQPEGQLRKPADNSKLMSILPDIKFTPLTQGLESTVLSFLDRFPRVRY